MSNSEIDELLLEISKLSNNDKQRAEVLNKLTVAHFRGGDFVSAKIVNREEYDLRVKLDDFEGEIQARHYTGVLAHLSSEIDEAEKIYLENFEKLKNSGYQKLKDQAIYYCANFYQHYIGDFKRAFEFYHLGYELAISTKDESRQAFFLDHLGMAKYWMEDFDQAIDFHERSWKIIQNLPRDINVLFHKIQLASAYIGLEDHERAFIELKSIFDLKLDNKDVYSNVWFLLILAQISKYDYDLIEKNEQQLTEICGPDLYAEDLIHLAIETGLEKNHTASVVQAKIMLAEEIYGRNINEASKLLSEALEISRMENRKREINLVKKTCEAHSIDFESL